MFLASPGRWALRSLGFQPVVLASCIRRDLRVKRPLSEQPVKGFLAFVREAVYKINVGLSGLRNRQVADCKVVLHKAYAHLSGTDPICFCEESEVIPTWPLLEIGYPPVQIQHLILKILDLSPRPEFRVVKKVTGIIPKEVKRLCDCMGINLLVVFGQREPLQRPGEHRKPLTKPPGFYRLLR